MSCGSSMTRRRSGTGPRSRGPASTTTPPRGRPARSSSTATAGSPSAASPATTAAGPSACPCSAGSNIRHEDLPELPEGIDRESRTKPPIAGELITWAGSLVGESAERSWVVVDGGDANREFLKPAQRAGFTVVARLRRDATLHDLPPAVPPGQTRGPGRPPTSGKDRLRGCESFVVCALDWRSGVRLTYHQRKDLHPFAMLHVRERLTNDSQPLSLAKRAGQQRRQASPSGCSRVTSQSSQACSSIRPSRGKSIMAGVSLPPPLDRAGAGRGRGLTRLGT